MQRKTVDRRTFLQYGGAAAVTVALAGCPEEEPVEETPTPDDTETPEDDDEDEDLFEVTVTQGQLTDTLDPVGENATPVYNIIDQGYEPFMYRDEEGRVVERIITDWDREGDQTIRLTVRDGVSFHSGSELTADDVAFSINRANDPDVSDVAGPIGAIVEATVDDGDVILELDQVEPAIFRNLAAFGRVVEQSWVEERNGDIDTEMNGTGPFELVEFVDDTHVIYEKFEDYWGPEPEVDGGEFNAVPEEGPRVDRLLAGDSDLIVNVRPDDIGEIQAADNVSSEFIPSTRTIFLIHNDQIEPFDSLEFRQAMNYAVDVQAIIDSLLNEFGVPTSQPTLEGHTGYNPDLEPYPYDPDEAESLIDESGYAGVEITLHTPIGRYLRDVDVAESAAAQINELPNVTCDVDRRDFGELVGEVATPDPTDAPAFFLLGWGNPTFDANYTVHPWMGQEGGIFRFFHDDDIADLISQANDLPDGEERTGLLQEANELARDRAAWTYLHQQYSIYGTNDRIEWTAREDEDILFEHITRA